MQLGMCWLSKVTVIGSPPKSMASLALCGQVFRSSCSVGFKSDQRTVGYHQSMHANSAPLGLLCLAVYCCGSQVSQQGKILCCFLPWMLALHFMVPWKLVLRQKAFRSGGNFTKYFQNILDFGLRMFFCSNICAFFKLPFAHLSFHFILFHYHNLS